MKNNNVIIGVGGAAYERNMVHEIKDGTCFILDTFNEFCLNEDYKFINFNKESINPFDFSIKFYPWADMTDTEEWINSCCSDQFYYLIDLFNVMGNFELTPIEKREIDKVLKKLYDPYIKYLLGNNITFDKKMCPDIKDFYEKIENISELNRLALMLEVYVNMSFLQKTSFNINKNEKVIYKTDTVGHYLSEIMEIICYHNMWINSMELKIDTKEFEKEKRYLFFNQFSDKLGLHLAGEIKKFRTRNMYCFLRYNPHIDVKNIFENHVLMNNMNNFYCFNISEDNVNYLADLFSFDEDKRKEMIDNCCDVTSYEPYVI